MLEGVNGLPRLVVETQTATGEIYLHGAHVTQWQPAGHQPVLWMSKEAVFAPGEPIRGGVPICLPWFGANANDPHAPSHGWARITAWTIESVKAIDQGLQVTLTLDHDSLSLRYAVCFGATLTMSLSITNKGDTRRELEAALHTYFDVGNIRQAEVRGLEDAPYRDSLQGRTEVPAAHHRIRFTGETDRIYQHAGQAVIHDPVLARDVVIDKAGSPSTVVWNPWIDKSARMADFGDQEWGGMLCVETAAVAPDNVSLESGQMHTLEAVIRVETPTA